MTRKKGNSLRDSTKETHTSSEAATRGSSHRPRSKVGQILGKVKGSLEDGVNKLRTRSKDSRNRSPVPPHEHASSTPNIEAAPSDAEVEADLPSVIQDTQLAARRMHPLSGPAITVASVGQDAQADLSAVDDSQDTYLKPLRIFDAVIGEIANLHPYAKMALENIFSTIARDLRRTLAGAVQDEISPKKTVQAVLRGHTSLVNSFSMDGTRIVTGSKDNTARLWDAGTGEPVGEPLRGHTSSVTSVSFSPDGTRTVTGSWDKTGQLMTLNTPNNYSISFSSNPIHALRNALELMEPVSHDDRTSIPFVLNDNEWVVGPKHQRLFWVPSASRFPFYNPATILMMPRRDPELDLSRMAHVQHWQKCRE